uniref:Uncharacterized protein n=1 Tax=viral metagenome TaxID=1070528 RepID=A0A6C0C8A4_9ZZZZ
MSRANKKNEEIESASSEEEVAVKKPAAKKALPKKAAAKPKAAPKKEVKKESVKEASEDEFSDIEVEDDETVANMEPETNDEVLVGTSKNQTSNNAHKQQMPTKRIDPATPVGELNVEQRINSLIDLAIETYNLPLKNRMLEIRREFTGKGKINNKPKQQYNNKAPVQQQQYNKSPNYGQNYRMMPETPNRDDYQMRPGPPMYNNNGRGQQRGGRGRGINNNPRRVPQDNDQDVYADV